jgi:anti-anti-sigma factor
MVDKHGDDIVILGLEGDLKKATHQLFMDNIEAVLANSSPSVILNLMLLEELDSVGLRSFISAMARVGQSGGKVVMVEV